MDPITIALIAIMAGNAIQYSATNKAHRDQQAAQVVGIQRQQDLQKQKSQITQQDTQQYDPAARQGVQTSLADQITQRLTGDVSAARDKGEGQVNDSTQGKVSNDYLTGKAKVLSMAMDRASQLARLNGNVASYGDQRLQEQHNANNSMASQALLDVMGRERAKTDDLVAQVKGVPNSGMMMLGNIIKTAGSLYGGGGTLANMGTNAANGMNLDAMVANSGFNAVTNNPWANAAIRGAIR